MNETFRAGLISLDNYRAVYRWFKTGTSIHDHFDLSIGRDFFSKHGRPGYLDVVVTLPEDDSD